MGGIPDAVAEVEGSSDGSDCADASAACRMSWSPVDSEVPPHAVKAIAEAESPAMTHALFIMRNFCEPIFMPPFLTKDTQRSRSQRYEDSKPHIIAIDRSLFAPYFLTRLTKRAFLSRA